MTKRLSARFACRVEAQACTPVDTVAATVVDLSRLGAQLRLDRPFARGTRIHLDIDGHYYWGTVMWDEPDRLGLRFRHPVEAGPLDAMLRRLQQPRRFAAPAAAALPARAAGFGRRVGAAGA